MLPIWLSPCTPSASFVLPTQYLAQTINPTLAPFSPLYTLYCFENPNGERRVSREASGGIEPPLFVLPLILGSLPFGVAVPFCSGGIARRFTARAASFTTTSVGGLKNKSIPISDLRG